MSNKGFTIPRTNIAAFCQRWKITEFSLFGSAIREDFGPDSDIDVLITVEPDPPLMLLDLAQMQIELENLFGRTVDLVENDALRNPSKRQEILRTAQLVYSV
jgi:predicted nucleotidyltransferase